MKPDLSEIAHECEKIELEYIHCSKIVRETILEIENSEIVALRSNATDPSKSLFVGAIKPLLSDILQDLKNIFHKTSFLQKLVSLASEPAERRLSLLRTKLIAKEIMMRNITIELENEDDPPDLKREKFEFIAQHNSQIALLRSLISDIEKNNSETF